MVEPLSPLGAAWRPGRHGNLSAGPGVSLEELRPGSIVEVAAWHDTGKALVTAIRKGTGLSLSTEPGAGAMRGGRAGFAIGPGRFMLSDRAEGLVEALAAHVGIETGTVTDLSHGRAAFRVAGHRAEWVLAKLFAIDFAPTAFPLHAGRATMHHAFFTQIQRSADDAFDLYVFRSFARSFWKVLCHAAEEVGYEAG